VKKVYEALNGMELATAIARATTRLALTIPGLNSRLNTFPMAQVEITIRLKVYDRAEVVITEMDEFIERLVAEGIESDTMPMNLVRDETHTLKLNEGDTSADAIRRSAGIPVNRPVPTPDGRIVDVPDGEPNPLPAGENMDNIVQFGAPGLPMPGTAGAVTSGKGRVIDLSDSGRLDASQEQIRPKLKGDPGASHFRVRER
jgi:hypothetical protein